MHKLKTALAASALALTAALGATVPATATPAAAPAAMADGHVYVWEHTGAGGASCKWSGDDSDYRYNTGCGNMNDRVSSASNSGYAGAYEDVLFYENIDRRGSFVCLPNGVYWQSMPGGWNDRVSSHSWGSAC
ncbi:peptidase inhibitor family I36 protein [Streptomyces sp. NPDC012888]|uniref:peptidase inhibitor family I36 protein n=1 Tax=Streptomyces sp. NPDC012888 TaxID=3364855 RepID=UPI00367E480C